MRSRRPSRTAEHNALFRALDARRPVEDRIVGDTLAEGLLSWRYRALVISAGFRVWGDAVARFVDRRWPGVRPTVLARTRAIDSLVAEIMPSTAQVVILGAGFDTRSWRLPELQGVRVFEVDHPATQGRKQRLLTRRELDLAQVRFVPTDFNLDRLDRAMSKAGFDPSQPTVFLWEGTTNYLSAEAVDATFRWCARAAAGSHLVFTYIDEDVLRAPSRYVGAERVFRTVRRVNEPVTFGLAPDDLADHLGERGLALVSDEGAASLRRRCYGTASAMMRGHEFYRVAHARVPGRSATDAPDA